MSDLCGNLCVQEKRAKLIQEGRRFICCNTGCYVKKCKKEVCSFCKGRHSRAICFKLEKSKQNLHLEEKNVDVKTKSSNSVFHNRGGVLLQCVKAEIIGRSSSDRIFCLFDNRSNGDEEILGEFDKSVSFVDGRYRVILPWKPDMREALQNNKTVARKHFEGLVRRFKCVHELFCEYKDVIDDYDREGTVDRTSCDSLSDSQGFYLPHHAVIRSDKTTSRIRIVFDGSAHEDGHL
ncbi:integrase catalytic domain-containing protein [Trichonephila clavipes]|nr:integrase catalytic domain-containing protein [Trichonephila clavipes]